LPRRVIRVSRPEPRIGPALYLADVEVVTGADNVRRRGRVDIPREEFVEVAVSRVHIAQEANLDVALEVGVGRNVDAQVLDGDMPAVHVRPMRDVGQVDEHVASGCDDTLRVQVDGVRAMPPRNDIETDLLVVVLGVVCDTRAIDCD
jgi:hypothetical protein